MALPWPYMALRPHLSGHGSSLTYHSLSRSLSAPAHRSRSHVPLESPRASQGVFIATAKQKAPTRWLEHANFSTGDAALLEQSLMVASLMVENVLLRGEKASLAEVAAERGATPSGGAKGGRRQSSLPALS